MRVTTTDNSKIATQHFFFSEFPLDAGFSKQNATYKTSDETDLDKSRRTLRWKLNISRFFAFVKLFTWYIYSNRNDHCSLLEATLTGPGRLVTPRPDTHCHWYCIKLINICHLWNAPPITPGNCNSITGPTERALGRTFQLRQNGAGRLPRWTADWPGAHACLLGPRRGPEVVYDGVMTENRRRWQNRAVCQEVGAVCARMLGLGLAVHAGHLWVVTSRVRSR